MNKILLFGLTLGVLISSCSKDKEQASPAQKDQSGEFDVAPSVETVSLSGRWKRGYYKGELIAYEEKNNMNLFLGDIIIPNEDISDKPTKKNDKIMGTGITGTTNLWPNRTMNYVIDPNTSVTRKQAIRTAMKNWSNLTGFIFLDVSKYAYKGDYVYIVYGNLGNNSYVGRIFGEQRINLQNDGVGVIVHELGHALGMYHEQERSDRDKYIKIIWSNIQEQWKPQYLAYACADNVIVNHPRTKFDYNSIMLYASLNSSAIDWSLPVMTKKNGDIWGDNVYEGIDAPSATDANWVKVRYKIK